ncbi:hypothetical protein SEA_JEEVES_45 [Mycobacterium phage Jeeves]|uniref:Uncharacterized protein n=1 Tax=Mycobacterium phage Jeeves TaxID=2652402 RepID=A0A5J6T531_9CAUD|nr:hypothetical protein KNU75_gp064 [Mycobacterium phage Jeeves]QFG04520.1 hypothetical protein SEA_JEEVES_45 [Mycobacterium phage Jeeves]
MAEHKEFFDVLYQQWSKTTGAKDRYWVVEQSGELWEVYAISPGEPDDPWFVATFNSEEDADFVAGLNGAVPDLIRHLGQALDENERLDEARDAAEGLAAEALLENAALKEEIRSLERQLDQ